MKSERFRVLPPRRTPFPRSVCLLIALLAFVLSACGPLDTLYGLSPDGRWLLVESSRDVNAMAVSSGSKRLHKEDS